MSSCTTSGCDPAVVAQSTSPAAAPVEVLREVVRRYGTPTYAYDLSRIRDQAAKLRAHVPAAVEVLYSLKANPSLGLCTLLAKCGFGADVASAGEIVTAQAAGFPTNRTFVTGPDRSAELLVLLPSLQGAVLSVDSVSELRLLAASERRLRAILRLRPDFRSYATCSAGPDSRFGVPMQQLTECRDHLVSSGIRIMGFHVFSGSQILSAEGMIHHLRNGVDQALRAGNVLGIAPEIIDLGGGFGIPYGPGDGELDMTAVGAELSSLVGRAAPGRLVLELGRYLIAPAGWYLTTVLSEQSHLGRPAVVVDGGSHQRGDLCGLGLRRRAFAPAVLGVSAAAAVPTDVLGCLSLPADVLLEAAPLPPLAPGDVLAFPNAGAYGLGASPWSFHSHSAPAEVAFAGSSIALLRVRRPPRSVLDDQVRDTVCQLADKIAIEQEPT